MIVGCTKSVHAFIPDTSAGERKGRLRGQLPNVDSCYHLIPSRKQLEREKEEWRVGQDMVKEKNSLILRLATSGFVV